MEHNFIPCVKWIKRGVAKSKPECIQLSKEELKGLVDKAKSDILGVAGGLKKSDENNESQNMDDQFAMEDYDKNDDVLDLIGIGGLITLDDEEVNADSQDDDEDDSDKEDDEIKPTDNLIAVGHVHGDMSVLEVYVFNEEDNDLYVHHDIVLPTVPLALEWLGNIPGQPSPAGNFLAIGGMSPEITIWNLDLVNSLEPAVKLGQFSTRKKDRHRNHGHSDAVLDLSWNHKLSHILASGSVDRSVLLWDLSKAKAVTQFKNFEEKVQTLEWHPSEVNILMAGSCDSKLRLFDCRIEEILMTVKVDGEVERTAWHPTSQFHAMVGTSSGTLCVVDCRSGNLIWQVKAHDKEVTGLGVCNSGVVTCSTDQTVKVWSLSDCEATLKYTKQTNMGELHCLHICPENPDIVCLGGSKKSCNFKVINLSTEMQQPDRDPSNMDVEPETLMEESKSYGDT